MLDQIFKNILILSAAGSVLSIIWLCLKPATKKIFSPKWQYYIWLTVLLVMMLPVSFSVPRIAPEPQIVRTAQQPTAPSDTAITETAVQLSEDYVQVSPGQSSQIQQPEIPQNIIRYLSIVWCFGAICSFAVKIIRYMVFSKAIRENSKDGDSVPNIPKRLRIRRTSLLDAPLIIGLFRTVLYLPDTELPARHMEHILMHELTHLRRNDILYKWFTMLVKCVHWFNPFIYIVSKQIDIECEVSCDAAVAAKLSEQERKDYMRMILDMISRSQSTPRPLTTQMAGNRKILERRFTMIKRNKKTGKLMSSVSAAAAVCMLSVTVFASGVASNELRSENTSDWARESIRSAETLSIMPSSIDDTTDLTQNITRSMFCDFAAAVLTENGITMTAWEYPFTDLDPNSDYSIHSLYCMDIVNGKTASEFRPGEPITREEAAAILYRMYRYTSLPGYQLSDYRFADDSDISGWAKNSVYNMRLLGVMDGTGNDTFDPKGMFTIEQTAAAMVRMYDILAENDTTISNGDEVRRLTRVFFSCFNQREFDVIKNELLTQSCISQFYGDGQIFGMTQAALDTIDIYSSDKNTFIVRAGVSMTPAENSVFGTAPDFASFYIIFTPQQDGSYLIDSFTTEL